MENLTSKQWRVLSFIRGKLRTSNKPPTYREIAHELNVDVRAAYQHVEALERKNIVVRAAGKRSRIGLNPEFQPQRGFPILGRVPAGPPLATEEEVGRYLDLDRLLVRDDLFAVEVHGESMIERGLLEGDLAVVRSQGGVRDGNIVVAAIGEEYTIKTLRTIDGQRHLCPENSSGRYSPLLAEREDVRMIGPVVLVVRELE